MLAAYEIYSADSKGWFSLVTVFAKGCELLLGALKEVGLACRCVVEDGQGNRQVNAHIRGRNPPPPKKNHPK